MIRSAPWASKKEFQALRSIGCAASAKRKSLSSVASSSFWWIRATLSASPRGGDMSSTRSTFDTGAPR